MSGVIASTIAAFSLAPFSATGGTFTVDANGYRHHIFNASGTLTASGAPKDCLVLLVGGGDGGFSGNANGPSGGRGGYGGRGSYWIRWNARVTGNTSIVVGAGGSSNNAGSQSSVSGGVSLNSSNVGGTQIEQSYNAGYIFDYYGGTMFANNAWVGTSGAAIKTAGGTAFGPYLNLANIPSNLGGHGGGGGAFFVPQNVTASSSAGATSGGGAGGAGSSPSAGTAGAANTGAGGGGGGSRITSYPGGESGFVGTSAAGGAGGSGYVIISYLI